MTPWRCCRKRHYPRSCRSQPDMQKCQSVNAIKQLSAFCLSVWLSGLVGCARRWQCLRIAFTRWLHGCSALAKGGRASGPPTRSDTASGNAVEQRDAPAGHPRRFLLALLLMISRVKFTASCNATPLARCYGDLTRSSLYVAFAARLLACNVSNVSFTAKRKRTWSPILTDE